MGYESMIRKGNTSCLGCHYTPGGGGMLTDYGKMVAFSEAPLKLRKFEESSIKKAMRFGGKMDHAVHLRLANVDTELSNDTFPMQGDYLAALRHKKITVLSTLARAPTRRSQSSVEEPAFIDTIYFRDLKIVTDIDRKHYFTFGREKQNLGLKLVDHTLYVKNYNKFNVTDLATLFTYDYLSPGYQITATAFGPNFQEGVDNKEYGGKFAIRRRFKRAVLGAGTLYGSTTLIDRQLYNLFGKYSPIKYLTFMTENVLTKRKSQQNIKFDQRTHLVGVIVSPFTSTELLISGEDIRREEPFYVDQQRIALGLRQKIIPNLTLQLDYKRSDLGQRTENLLVSQLFLNGW